MDGDGEYEEARRYREWYLHAAYPDLTRDEALKAYYNEPAVMERLRIEREARDE